MTAFKIYPDEQAPTLDQLLNEQGYEIEGESNVMTCPIQSGLAPESIGFKAETELSDWWLDAAAALNGISDGKRPYLRQILQNIQPTHAFASFRDGNEPVAVGLAVGAWTQPCTQSDGLGLSARREKRIPSSHVKQ